MTRQGPVGRQPDYRAYERIGFNEGNDRLRRGFFPNLQLSRCWPDHAHQLSCAPVAFLCPQDPHETIAKVNDSKT